MTAHHYQECAWINCNLNGKEDLCTQCDAFLHRKSEYERLTKTPPKTAADLRVEYFENLKRELRAGCESCAGHVAPGKSCWACGRRGG